MANRGHFLRVNDYLRPYDWLESRNGMFFAIMQRDANLVVYQGGFETGGKGLWAYSERALELGDYFAVLQSDGNLCVYRGTGPDDNRGAIWCARSEPMPPRDDYVLVMRDDGNLCVMVGDRGYVWGWMKKEYLL